MTDYTNIHNHSLNAIESLRAQFEEIVEAGNEFEDDIPFNTAALQDINDAIESIVFETLDMATEGLVETCNDKEVFPHVQMMVEYWEKEAKQIKRNWYHVISA